MTIDEIKKLSEETPYTVENIASSVQSSKRLALPLNLQFFAEPTDPEDPPADPEDPPTDPKDPNPEDPPAKTFTQAELDDIVEQRLKRAEKDKQKAIDEAKKLAKMNADEKREYEFEKLQEENKRLLAEQNNYSLGKEASKMLVELGVIPGDYVSSDKVLKIVVGEDAESTNEQVKFFSDLVDEISQARAKEWLKGTPPKKQKGVLGALTKAEIMKEPDNIKRQKMIQENRHLFK